MKAANLLAYSVVLWTLLECGHARRIPRSLDVESGGGNLTQKQQEEVFHVDVLQHFTTTPRIPPEASTRGEPNPSFSRDVPGIPEDINVQSLKNEENFHVKYDRAETPDKEVLSEDSSNNRKETVKSIQNDVIYPKFNQTKTPTLTNLEAKVLQPSIERFSSVISDEKTKVENERLPVVSSTQSSKTDTDWKAFELKKKEKIKKEILEAVSVPSDHIGAGRIEKPYKDNALNVKLKEKTKDMNTEALDDRRSTTIRISFSNSSRSSVSISEHDNSDSLGKLEDLKVESPSSSNNEEVDKLNVNSVINTNGVNNDSSKKTRIKYSPKGENNDTEVDHSSENGNLLNEDTANDSTSRVNLYPHVTYSTLQTSTTSAGKVAIDEQKIPIPHIKPTDSTPTKVDMFVKPISPSPTTAVVKPNIAFKQQIANKLKSLEPVPTMPIFVTGEETEDQDKSGKSPTKSGPKKKPRPDYHAPSSEMYIPPTATAWTLISMKPAAETLTTSQKHNASPDEKSSTTENLSMTGQTTVIPVTRVKSFVPWSTRLLKTTTIRPSTTTEIIDDKDKMGDSDDTSLVNHKEALQKKFDHLEKKEALLQPSSSTVEEKSVIRTTTELERNITETSANLIPSSLNDVMIKDQSSTKSQVTPTTAGSVITKTTAEPSKNSSVNELSGKSYERDNVIDTKIPEEDEPQIKSEDTYPEVFEDKNLLSLKNKTVNEVLSSDLSQTVNEIKLGSGNDNHKINVTKLSTTPTQLESEDLAKTLSDAHDSDTAAKDIFLDVAVDDTKSEEESDEDEKPKQTTTISPKVEHFETTLLPDSDEDDGENDREDDELPVISEKLPTAQSTNFTVSNSTQSTEVKVQSKPTTPSLPGTYENSTVSYVTSFDIISKDNLTQDESKTPLQGDINWYSVDSKPVINASHDEASPKIVPVTTTAIIETTIVPETTTEMGMQETTLLPETTKTVVMNISSTMSVLITEPTEHQEDNLHSEDSDDTMACVTIELRNLSPLEFCQDQRQLRENIASQLTDEKVSWEQVHVVSRRLQGCEMRDLSEEEQLLEVEVCFVDRDQEPSFNLRNKFLQLYNKRDNNLNFPIVDIQNTIETPIMDNADGFDNVFAAIVLSVIAGICLVLLGILLVIVRKRQGTFNYGQRCTPVSLDDYSLDNISVYNSVRRKGNRRASKRSYGNPAFDDPGGPSHSVNFAGLANFSNDREALNEEFSQIPTISVKSDELPPNAESKNRYANVIPLPETRVQLQVKEGADPLKEYINANFIKGPKGQDKLFIACQGPMQSTTEDFWRMVWQQQSKVILMLTALNENGVEKCADYFPHQEITDCNRLFGDFQVTLNKQEVREKYIVSHLQIKNLETNLLREVTHLWYSSWPDKGVPDDGSAMIAFLIEARSYTRGAQGPTVVHCSPGTGRTGTVIAIDLCIRDFETQRTVDIPKTVYALRRDRAGAVQTKDQYSFIYQVLNLYATKLTGGALDSI